MQESNLFDEETSLSALGVAERFCFLDLCRDGDWTAAAGRFGCPGLRLCNRFHPDRHSVDRKPLELVVRQREKLG